MDVKLKLISSGRNFNLSFENKYENTSNGKQVNIGYIDKNEIGRVLAESLENNLIRESDLGGSGINIANVSKYLSILLLHTLRLDVFQSIGFGADSLEILFSYDEKRSVSFYTSTINNLNVFTTMPLGIADDSDYLVVNNLFAEGGYVCYDFVSKAGAFNLRTRVCRVQGEESAKLSDIVQRKNIEQVKKNYAKFTEILADIIKNDNNTLFNNMYGFFDMEREASDGSTYVDVVFLMDCKENYPRFENGTKVANTKTFIRDRDALAEYYRTAVGEELPADYKDINLSAFGYKFLSELNPLWFEFFNIMRDLCFFDKDKVILIISLSKFEEITGLTAKMLSLLIKGLQTLMQFIFKEAIIIYTGVDKFSRNFNGTLLYQDVIDAIGQEYEVGVERKQNKSVEDLKG